MLPLRPRDKRPLTAHGFLDATTNTAQLEKLWKRCPDANVGMACGEASRGAFAVDVDPRNDGDASWAELRATHHVPATPESVTGGGGAHVLFRGPVSCTVIAPGVDIKANGGYIVLPPSVHPNGRRYEWDALSRPDDMPVAEAPAWLLERCGVRRRRDYHQHQASVDPRSFALGAAFLANGRLGEEIRPGVFAAHCPNEGAHSCGKPFDSSTVIFAPGPGNRRGRFFCSHEHCRGKFH